MKKLVFILSGSLLAGCTTLGTEYLGRLSGDESRDEIIEKIGQPVETVRDGNQELLFYSWCTAKTDCYRQTFFIRLTNGKIDRWGAYIDPEAEARAEARKEEIRRDIRAAVINNVVGHAMESLRNPYGAH